MPRINNSLKNIDDFIMDYLEFCSYKNLSVKTIKYYHQTLMLFSQYLKEEKDITDDNSPKNWTVLELKYFVSPYISEILNKMQTGAAREKNNELIIKYGITDINSENTFAEHIEKTIEMFS
jgi:hypothetical protein